jgi:glucose-1-phosphate cytidylyltransferase
VIQIYLAQGFRRFLLLTGYQAELIDRFAQDSDWPAGTTVQCLDTGLDTPTGARVLRAGGLLRDEPFCLTYADGVADIDLQALLAEHARHGPVATMTVVRPELQFGVAELNGDGVVRGFVEKPRSEHWVNGGFFCFEPALFDVLEDASVLERQPLATLAAQGQLRAFRHEGFWDCLDTYKDAQLLNDLWQTGAAPWKLWA